MKVNCFGWLRDTEEGRKYAAKHPKARTGPLPTLGAKGNLSPKEKAQVADEFTGEACWEASESVRNRQEWQVDSGATSHMTPDRTAFIEYAMLSTRQSVVAANGSTLPGIGRGRVRIPVSVDGHTRSIVLTDVLHVPQIKGNLISVARLQDKGLVVETTAPPKRMALVIKNHGRKVGVASRVGRSYILDMPTESAMPAGLATDRQEGVTDSQGEVTDHQEEVTDRQASVYARWHQRFGHLGPQLIEKVHKVVGDMPQHVRPIEGQPTCEVCALTKKVRVINRASPERSIEPLARVFSDFWGPYREPALTGDVYMLTFTDDYTRKSWVTLTKLRSVLPSVYARWKAFVELQSGFKVKAIRCDNATEYKAMQEPVLSPEGITLELTTVYSPWQNGVAERLNRTLVTMARSMLQHAKLPLRFWGFAVIAACYLRNRMPIGPDGKCPEEAFTGRKASVSHIRTFGCIAYAHIPKETRGKLELVARKTIFVGYLPTSRQY
jgi:hypothetical protein